MARTRRANYKTFHGKSSHSSPNRTKYSILKPASIDLGPKRPPRYFSVVKMNTKRTHFFHICKVKFSRPGRLLRKCVNSPINKPQFRAIANSIAETFKNDKLFSASCISAFQDALSTFYL
jgi:hypothetical protein